MSESFDRIRPPRDRLLRRGDDGDPTAGDTAAGGVDRRALFSAGRAGHGAVPVAVRCSRCAATTDLDLATALRAALPLMLVAPWRRDPVFARCPACRRRSWLALEVGS